MKWNLVKLYISDLILLIYNQKNIFNFACKDYKRRTVLTMFTFTRIMSNPIIENLMSLFPNWLWYNIKQPRLCVITAFKLAFKTCFTHLFFLIHNSMFLLKRNKLSFIHSFRCLLTSGDHISNFKRVKNYLLYVG